MARRGDLAFHERAWLTRLCCFGSAHARVSYAWALSPLPFLHLAVKLSDNGGMLEAPIGFGVGARRMVATQRRNSQLVIAWVNPHLLAMPGPNLP